MPRIEGEVQRYQIGPDGDEWVKADDYAALNDYAALVQMERDSARAEVAENDGVIRVWRRRAETAEAEVERLTREVHFLRLYGNKDCTAMADEAMARDAVPTEGQ